MKIQALISVDVFSGDEEEGEQKEKAKGQRSTYRPAILEEEALAGQGMGAALKVRYHWLGCASVSDPDPHSIGRPDPGGLKRAKHYYLTLTKSAWIRIRLKSWIRIHLKTWIRIRINSMWIRNTGLRPISLIVSDLERFN
jgi:hypothetical protein